MVKKQKMNEYTINFLGQTKVKAYTKNHAESIVSNAKDIKTTKIKVETIKEQILKCAIVNIPVIITTIIMIVMITIWRQLLLKTQQLPTELQLMYLTILCIFIITTMKFPKIISRWQDFN